MIFRAKILTVEIVVSARIEQIVVVATIGTEPTN